VRDGIPLPGRTPAQLLSQLAHRTLGPLRVLIRAGYTPASASGRIAQTHPLIRSVRANRYCLIEPGFAAGPLQFVDPITINPLH